MLPGQAEHSLRQRAKRALVEEDRAHKKRRPLRTFASQGPPSIALTNGTSSAAGVRRNALGVPQAREARRAS